MLSIGSSLKLLILPILFYLNWEFVLLFTNAGWSNPFSRVFLLSGHIQDSKPDDQRYQKSWWDLLFLAYYIIFFAFIRQSILIYIARPLAIYFGLRRPAKIDRFGEQTYALVYFAVFGAWGYVRPSLVFQASSLMSISVSCQVFQRTGTILPNSGKASAMYPLLLTLITHYTGYPHWDIKAELKCYYLLQFSHWLQELLVVLLGLEKARKDYLELVTHHIVTLWLIGYDPFYCQSVVSDIRQVELFRKYDIYWQCCLHEHGCTRFIPSCAFTLDYIEIVLIPYHSFLNS